MSRIMSIAPLLVVLIAPCFAQPPSPTKTMITEVTPYTNHAIELANFDTTIADLTNHVLRWRHSGVTRTSSPLGITLNPNEIVVVRDASAPSGLNIPTFVTQVVAFSPLSVPFGASVTVALVAPSGAVEDEVQILGLTPSVPSAGSLGGIFRGNAQPGALASGTPSVERIWGLDSDSAGDWCRAKSQTLGRENTANGPRTSDPAPMESFLINEVDVRPGFTLLTYFNSIELLNTSGTTVDLKDWSLVMHLKQGAIPRRLFPWTTQTLVPAGAFVVLWDRPLVGLPPSEIPPGTLVFSVGAGANGIPLGTREYSVALYDDLGRLIDLVRANGLASEYIHNHPRAPSAWNDFRGAVPRPLNNSSGIGRFGPDTNLGSDWRPTFSRSMGLPNTEFADAPGDGNAPDVRLHEGSGGNGLVIIINAGPSWAGANFYLLLSANRAFGIGPILGMNTDCLTNFYNLSLPLIPPFGGFLDTDGTYRFEVPANGLPPGITSDNLIILQSAQSAFSKTRVLQFDT